MEKYLQFNYIVVPNMKTKLFEVRNKENNQIIGYIRWYGAWRQYCFMPSQDTVFNKSCLEEINIKIQKLMDEWRNSKNEASKF